MLLLSATPVSKKFTYAEVPENKRSYSSVWDNSPIGTGHARSTIDSPQAWSAKTNQPGEWIQFDLGQERTVAGTVIQPRFDVPKYTTEYTVSTSLDGKSWTAVPGKYNGYALLPSDKQTNKFSNEALVRARYVRMIVIQWIDHVSLRADVLIAEGDDGKFIRHEKQSE